MDSKQYDWDNLPVPDEEQSWRKMKALLEEDNERVPPPLFFRTCAGWGLFGIALLTGLWLIIHPVELRSDKQTAQEEKERDVASEQKETLSHTSKETTINADRETNSGADRKKTIEEQNNQTNINTETDIPESNEITIEIENRHVNGKRTSTNDLATKKSFQKKSRPFSPSSVVVTSEAKKLESEVLVNASPKLQDGFKGDDHSKPSTGMYPSDSLDKASAMDTTPTKAFKADTTSKKEEQPSEEKKKKDQQKKPFYVTAGLGLQQQIPVAGQDAFPYNYYGRKGSLSDYIPSAYVRLHKENNWFVQAEFRYGAPQSVKDFSYSRQTVYDTSNQSLTTTSLYLRKTYYHQIPLSFNYYVKPNWSFGMGGVYSRFYGAVTEEEVKSRNVLTQAEKISRKIIQIPEYNDSFLYKTQLHLMIQTDYQWKRFSFGLRYKKDIQPYIKYTQPDGKVDVKKNQSLEAIIRFRIFKTRIFGM